MKSIISPIDKFTICGCLIQDDEEFLTFLKSSFKTSTKISPSFEEFENKVKIPKRLFHNRRLLYQYGLSNVCEIIYWALIFDPKYNINLLKCKKRLNDLKLLFEVEEDKLIIKLEEKSIYTDGRRKSTIEVDSNIRQSLIKILWKSISEFIEIKECQEINLELINKILKEIAELEFHQNGVVKGKKTNPLELKTHLMIQFLSNLLRFDEFMKNKNCSEIHDIEMSKEDCHFVFDFIMFFNLYAFKIVEKDNNSTITTKQEGIIRSRLNNFPKFKNPEAFSFVTKHNIYISAYKRFIYQSKC